MEENTVVRGALLVFGIFTRYSGISSALPLQADLIRIIQSEKAEMETIVA